MSRHLLILADKIGRNDAKLGDVLMRSFVHTLARHEDPPLSVMLLNEGVRLACEGSAVLEDLLLLQEKGITVKACGTCLDHLGLRESLATGEVGTMAGTVETLMGRYDVVTIA